MKRVSAVIYATPGDVLDYDLHKAEAFNDNGIFEITLPEWSGYLNHAGVVNAVRDLRAFCDQVEAALAEADQPETAVKS